MGIYDPVGVEQEQVTRFETLGRNGRLAYGLGTRCQSPGHRWGRVKLAQSGDEMLVPLGSGNEAFTRASTWLETIATSGTLRNCVEPLQNAPPVVQNVMFRPCW